MFSARVIDRIYAKTGGIPRLINILCDRAMLGAYVKSRRKVSLKILQKAAREVQGRSPRQRWVLRGSIVASLFLVATVAMAALLYTNGQDMSALLPRQLHESLADIVGGSSVVANSELSRVAMLDANTAEADDRLSALPVWPAAVTAEGNTLAAAHAVLFIAETR